MRIQFVLGILMPVAAWSAGSAEQVEYFEKTIRPLLVENCYACHSAETKPAGGLRVDDRRGLLKGGDSGPAVTPGQPEKSLLLARVRHADPRRRMPKEGSVLGPEAIAALERWIRDGAAWPEQAVEASPSQSASTYERLRKRHWAFQPVRKTSPPEVAAVSWPKGAIDRFVLAKLEAQKLAPVADAKRAELLRRLSFDLVGLPPSWQELQSGKEPIENVVDRLLASPRFGERWGRHWLDVARYGESSGPSRNIPYPHAWRYRDYVIDAVNRDVPFNRFLREQIAGDLLPAANEAERDRLQIATGFLALGPKDVNQRFHERFLLDNAAEQIDTVTRSALAMTVACARCHDHKFDPVPTKDYYALAGIFLSTVDAAGVKSKMGGAGLDYYDPKLLVRLASYRPPAAKTPEILKLEAEVAVAKKAWDEIRGTPEGLAIGPNGRPKQQPFRLAYERLQGELLRLTDPATYGFAVHGARESGAPVDAAIRIRGEAEKLGAEAPRGFLSAVEVPGALPVDRTQSGRLQLADWIASAQNPLTARVFVNRVWMRLFGEGLVNTVDNFGVTGGRPTHPELLDYLAARFVEEGWSLKKLVREIVLSRTYGLSSVATAAHRDVDPDNRLLWRHTPRRLDAEELRDAMLLSSDALDLSAPGASPVSELRMIEMRDTGPEAQAIQEKALASRKRSVYLPGLRGVTPKALEAFDPVSQTLVTGKRDATTVPAQALYLMNSGFVRERALEVARVALLKATPELMAQSVYRAVLGRKATAQEVQLALQFVRASEGNFSREGWREISVAAPVVRVAANDGVLPPDPDNIDRTEFEAREAVVKPKDAREAAWMEVAQALFASAEFRFVK